MFKKTLVILFVSLSVLATATATFAQGRKMGLFVGIDEYQGGISSLKSCVNDAVGMQTKLARKYGFETSNTSLLKNEQATRQNILEKLEYYERQTSKGDLFIFYYSGHGTVFPDAYSLAADETEPFGMPTYFPTGYYDSALVPVDGRGKTSGKAWNNLILDDELNAIFSRYTAKGVQVIFISDSCHAGSLGKGLENTGDFKFVAPKAIGFNSEDWKQVVSRRGVKSGESYNKLFLVIGSSQDNQFSRAGGSQDMSLFTKVLIAKINELAANKIFTYQSVFEAVNAEVDARSNGEQTPRLDDRFFHSSLLNKPIFSLPSAASGNGKIRIVAKVIDENGAAISGASFGIFKSGTDLGKGKIQKADVLLLGTTNGKGIFDSASQTFEPERYQVKVVKAGYQAYIREMEVVSAKNNTLVFVFKLVRE
jgi:metacaspase-1